MKGLESVQRPVLNNMVWPQGWNLSPRGNVNPRAGVNNSLYCLEEWRGVQIISPPGDFPPPRGQNLLLGANLRMGLWRRGLQSGIVFACEDGWSWGRIPPGFRVYNRRPDVRRCCCKFRSRGIDSTRSYLRSFQETKNAIRNASVWLEACSGGFEPTTFRRIRWPLNTRLLHAA
jgi:hypothetical protein